MKKGSPTRFFSVAVERLARSRLFRSLFRSLNRPRAHLRRWPLRVQGHPMSGHTLDRMAALILWKFGAIERPEIRFVMHVLRPGQTFVDVGANVGYYALLAARRVGEDGRVYAFEPDRENFESLVDNVRRNHLATVV